MSINTFFLPGKIIEKKIGKIIGIKVSLLRTVRRLSICAAKDAMFTCATPKLEVSPGFNLLNLFILIIQIYHRIEKLVFLFIVFGLN